jgi:hypothetical protein
MALHPEAALWLSGGLLTVEEIRQLRDRGVNVTDFAHEIGSSDLDALADAVSTIKEHHPGESVWVEA